MMDTGISVFGRQGRHAPRIGKFGEGFFRNPDLGIKAVTLGSHPPTTSVFPMRPSSALMMRLI
jgi:hypothetical protein